MIYQRSALILLLLAAVPAAAGEFPVKIEETVLENGMQVYCVKRPGAPQAACVLAVRTGASAERAGYTGIAHFLEHMLFKGTDKIGVKDPAKDRELRARIDEVMAELMRLTDEGAKEELLAPLREERDRLFAEQQENLVLNHIFKIYGEAGSSVTNAFTSDDMTAFIAVLPRHKLELFFWVEAERFRHPVFRQFHSEKNVVREERRLGENRPGHDFQEELRRVLFGSHPYSHPVIGYHEDLRRLSRADMRAFFDTYYTPDNMFLMVAGDVEAADVFKLAERYFGDWEPYAGKRPRIPPVPPARSGPTRVYGSGPGSASLEVAYRLPPSGSPTDVEADLIRMQLGDEEGALARKLVEERGVATRVNANLEAKRFGSVLWVSVEMKEGHSPEEAERDVLQAVQGLVDAPLPEKTMEELRRRYRARVLGSVKSDMRIGFRLLRHFLKGSWRDIDRNLEYAKTVSADSVRALAAEYLVPVNRVVGIYETKARPAAAPSTRPAEPAPAAAGKSGLPESWEDLEFPRQPLEVPSGEPFVSRLANGIRVVAVPDPADPVFRISAVVHGGSASDPAGKEGAADILAATLRRSGLPDMPREEVRVALEEIVGDYGVSAGRFDLTFSLDTFPQFDDRAIELLRRLWLSSVLDPEVAAAEKAKLRSRLVDAAAQPGAQSRRAFLELLWPGDERTRRATPASVEAVGADDLEAALALHRDPRRLILVVSGPFDRAEMLKRLDAAFGGLEPGEGTVKEIPASLARPAATGLHVMDFESSQGYVRIGARTVSRTDPRYPAVWALQSILSRRIFNRIRSNEGLSYQAAARLSPDWEVASPFAVVFQTKNRSVPFGIALALDELRKIAAEGPRPEELEQARTAHRGRLERTMGRASGRADAFSELLLHGVALDWHARFRSALMELGPEEVRAVAAEFLARDALAVAAVGRRAEMEPGDGEHPETLADFGPMKLIEPPSIESGPESPSSVVLAVIRAVSRGDLDALLPLVGGMLKERLAAPEAKQQLAMQGQFLSGATYRVGETVEDGDRADVTVDFEIQRGGQAVTMAMAFALERADGRWLCTGFRPKGR